MFRKYPVIFFSLVVLASAALHFWRIDYPNRPVFDEAHFATYAADYAKGIAHFDIHPPLGKLIYAGTLLVSGASLRDIDTRFISFVYHPDTEKLETKTEYRRYGAYPFVLLRAVGAMFGIALPVIVAGLVVVLGGGPIAAAIAAVFVLLENAILLETRLILLNGMYLSFGLVALVAIFKKRARPIVAGICLGLSLAVKLVGVVFLFPIVAWVCIASDRGRALRHAIVALTVALAVFAVIGVVGGSWYRAADVEGALANMGFWKGLSHEPLGAARASAITVLAGAGGYVGGGTEWSDYDKTNPWYGWPFGLPWMSYWSDPARILAPVMLVGNPAVWLLATLAAVVALATLFRRADRVRLHTASAADRGILILLAGWVGTLVIFALFIKRSTYLYHYFPALIFAIGIFALLFERWLGADRWGALSHKKKFVLLALFALALFGFLVIAPFTYGI